MSRLRTRFEEHRSKGENPGHITIAIVDANEKLFEVYSVGLGVSGYRVIGYPSVDKLLEVQKMEPQKNVTSPDDLHDRLLTESVSADEIDFIIVGQKKSLPDKKNGLAAARKISQRHPRERIIVTSPDLSVEKKALTRGFGFLQKPFTIDDLHRYVRGFRRILWLRSIHGSPPYGK